MGRSSSVVVLVLAHARPRYLARTLRSLLRADKIERYPIVISQDGEDPSVSRVIARYSGRLTHRFHRARPAPRSARDPLHGYACIAAHLRAALARVFSDRRVDTVLVLEDDLELAPDFFTFFEAALPIVARDPSLWAAAAWNDNGRAAFARDPERVLRSDWLPNLGWSLSRRLWEELGPRWPERFWDDWMRAPEQRRGRTTLRPEVSRVRTFGAEGTSGGQFYRRYIKRVVLNRRPARFDGLRLERLSKAPYDAAYLARIRAATPITARALARVGPGGDLRVSYHDEAELSGLLDRLGLMNDPRGGTARTAYLGVVELRRRGRLVFLAPAALSASARR